MSDTDDAVVKNCTICVRLVLMVIVAFHNLSLIALSDVLFCINHRVEIFMCHAVIMSRAFIYSGDLFQNRFFFSCHMSFWLWLYKKSTLLNDSCCVWRFKVAVSQDPPYLCVCLPYVHTETSAITFFTECKHFIACSYLSYTFLPSSTLSGFFLRITVLCFPCLSLA